MQFWSESDFLSRLWRSKGTHVDWRVAQKSKITSFFWSQKHTVRGNPRRWRVLNQIKLHFKESISVSRIRKPDGRQAGFWQEVLIPIPCKHLLPVLARCAPNHPSCQITFCKCRVAHFPSSTSRGSSFPSAAGPVIHCSFVHCLLVFF